MKGWVPPGLTFFLEILPYVQTKWESASNRKGRIMAAKFELYKDKAGEYRWRLRHQNGNIIADSGEGYTTKANAINGLESVKENGPTAPIDDQTD